MQKKWQNAIALAGSVVGAMLYLAVLYLVLMCLAGGDFATTVHINLHNEAVWEILMLPPLGAVVFAGVYLNYRRWRSGR